jgi:hypothetical protein
VDDPEDHLRLGQPGAAWDTVTSWNSSGWPGALAVNMSARHGPLRGALPRFETVTFGEVVGWRRT